MSSLQANIWVKGVLATDKAQRGKAVQAAVVMDIPEGYHVNSSKPLGKYAIPTVVEITAPSGVKEMGPVTYPRAVVKRYKFSEEQLAVYEGRAVMRFNLTVPADQALGSADLRVRVRYQSCTDEVCFAPASREVSVPIEVVGATDPVKRVNAAYFAAKARS
ncbi:MAG: protein-disulfide reductase DsbD N-terminal domain-containing protein [Pyrinomonadaceae bacterium]